MNIFIEADALVGEKMSGIGHATLEIIRSLSHGVVGTENLIIAIVPFGKKNKLLKYDIKNLKIRQLPPGGKLLNYLLTRSFISVPVDLWFGRGIYIYPNYKTWYTPFSKSYTFIHDVAYKIYPDMVYPKNLKYLESNMVRWINRATGILTISKSSRKDILRYFPFAKEKISVVYLGVDADEYYRRDKNEIKRVIDKYNLNKKYFLYVGNIEPRKNINLLLKSYKIYCDKSLHKAQLVLVGGDGWQNEDIKKNIETMVLGGYDIKRPNSYVIDADLPALYSGAVALVNLSIHEGYGLSLSQAQSCGTEIITSDLDVFKENLSDDGVHYVPINDAMITAQEMIEASENKVWHKNPVILHKWSDTAKAILSVTGIMGVRNER